MLAAEDVITPYLAEIEVEMKWTGPRQVRVWFATNVPEDQAPAIHKEATSLTSLDVLS